MDKEKRMTPELRFPGFDGDWEQRKLDEIAEVNPKSVLPDTFEYIDLESVVGTEILSHRTEKKESAPSRAQRLAKEGDVFYQTVRPYQRNNCIFEKPYKDWVFSTGYAQLRPQNDGYFLLTLLQNDSFVNMVLDRCTGTSYPAINANDLAEIEIMSPSNSNEQKDIGDFFRSLDNLITLHQRQLDDMKDYKKGLLQKMFPKEGEKVPELRFPGFTDDWEQRKLDEIAEVNPKSVLPDTFEYIDLESVVGTEILSHRTEKKESAPSRAQRLAKEGDVFYQTVRPYQRNNCIFEKPYKDWVFSTGYAQLRPQNDGYFLLTLLQNDSFVNMVLDRCTGTSYPAINANDLAEIEIMSPSNSNEQKDIGDFFRSLDNLITLHQQQLEDMKVYKKGLLQKMFV